MNSGKVIIAAAGLLMLCGCATHLEKGATRNLEAQCAAMGRQFVKTESKKTEALVVASATVTGECIGPDDPRYVSEAVEG